MQIHHIIPYPKPYAEKIKSQELIFMTLNSKTSHFLGINSALDL